MNGKVPAAKGGKARYALAGRPGIKVHMDDDDARQLGAAPQRPFNVPGVVQPARAEHVDNKMAPGKAGTQTILKPTDFRPLPWQVPGLRYDIPHDVRGFTMVFLLGGA